MIPFFFFFFWLAVTYMSLLTFKNTKIYYLCSYSRKAFAHVVAVISICYLLRDFVVPHTSNKVISIHEIQVNNIRSKQTNKKKVDIPRTSCIKQCEKQKTTRRSTKGNSIIYGSSIGSNFSQFGSGPPLCSLYRSTCILVGSDSWALLSSQMYRKQKLDSQTDTSVQETTQLCIIW